MQSSEPSDTFIPCPKHCYSTLYTPINECFPCVMAERDRLKRQVAILNEALWDIEYLNGDGARELARVARDASMAVEKVVSDTRPDVPIYWRPFSETPCSGTVLIGWHDGEELRESEATCRMDFLIVDGPEFNQADAIGWRYKDAEDK